jgi:hypothetical protein
MASKPAAGGPARKKPASRRAAGSRAASRRGVDGNPTRQADEDRPSAHLMSEVRAFCAQRQIEDEVQATIRLAKRHFTIVGEPIFRVVNDPDCGEHYLGIHVRAEGRPDQVFRQSEAFLDSFLESIDPCKQGFINLIYHPTQE